MDIKNNGNPGRENNNDSNCYRHSSPNSAPIALLIARMLSGQGLVHDIIKYVDRESEDGQTCALFYTNCFKIWSMLSGINIKKLPWSRINFKQPNN